jgi:SAM-dependent methyltransferase
MVERALSFGPAAEQYDRLRPRYPEAALRWALGEQPRRVVDLGAGTGILSRAVAALGHEVVPVEPDEAMRAQLVSVSPGLTPVPGRAEEIPLPDGDADAVVAGQAYHWFDQEPTHAEVARVLRPGGVFAPLWNSRDESVSWVVALSTIADDALGGRGIRDNPPRPHSFGDVFTGVERAVFTHSVTHTPESLFGLVATRSYYLTASPAKQHALELAVRGLCANHPDLAGRDTFELPYQTIVYRAHRRPPPAA